MSPQKSISVAIISGLVGNTPEDVAYSFVFDEANRLAQKGIKVHVIRSNYEKGSSSYGVNFHGIDKKIDLKALEWIIINITNYPLFSLLRNPLTLYWENLYALNVFKIIKKNKIDIIHAHFAYPEGLIGLLTKKNTGKPLLVTVHGADILIEPSVGYGSRLNKKIDQLTRRVLNASDIIIAASNTTFTEASKIVDTVEKIHLIPNGVDINRFNPNLDSSNLRKKLGIETDATIVFSLRSHEPKYGLEYLIQAIPLVLKKEKNIIFIIGSDGSLKPYLEKLAVGLGISEKIIFTGRITQSDLPYYYVLSDMVVVPSVQEAFGLVVSEAMACEKPVIGTEVGGIPDQIIDGYNGFLVQPRKPKEIAKKILWLLQNPEEAKRMGTNGRKIVEEKFNIDKRTDRIISLYKMLLTDSSL